jgi:hypothetical protein
MDFPGADLPVLEADSLEALVRANAKAMDDRYTELARNGVLNPVDCSKARGCGAALQVLRKLVAFMDARSSAAA